MYQPRRTSKIQKLIELYNSTDYYVADHFTGFSPRMMIKYLMNNSGKIEDVIVIRRKNNKDSLKSLFFLLYMMIGYMISSIFFIFIFKSPDIPFHFILFFISWFVASIFTIGMVYSSINFISSLKR